MDQTAIFSPVIAMLMLTLVVWVYMFARRIPWIQANDLTPEQFRPQEFNRIQPPEIAAPSDNFKNLFEVPVLFYVVAFYLFLTEQVDGTYMVAAWVFVAFRISHSLMHCTINIVIVRFYLYAISTLAVFFMIVRSALALV